MASKNSSNVISIAQPREEIILGRALAVFAVILFFGFLALLSMKIFAGQFFGLGFTLVSMYLATELFNVGYSLALGEKNLIVDRIFFGLFSNNDAETED